MSLKIAVTTKDHIQGQADAPIVLVEYGDYQCPHCGHAHPIVKRVQKHFGQRLAFVFRNFPLREAHAHAEHAAETAEFAATHGKFWEMHDTLFEHQNAFDRALFLRLSKSLSLPVEELDDALNTGIYADRVQSDFMGGVRSGVNGTPTFFINGHRHDGPFEFDDLVAGIEARL